MKRYIKSAVRDLSNSSIWDDRYTVAKNPATRADVLEKLAHDSEMGIRYAVAGNPSTPDKVLSYLLDDNSIDVPRNVLMNSNTSDTTLKKYLNKFPGDFYALTLILGRPNLNPDIKQVIAEILKDALQSASEITQRYAKLIYKDYFSRGRKSSS